MRLKKSLTKKMMRIMVKRAISSIVGIELLLLLSILYSKTFFINMQVGYLSSLFIILGASYAYKKMVIKDVESGKYEDERDILEKIEDPHELYDEKEINSADVEELDLKAIVKEEKAKIKTLSAKNIKHGAKGSISLYRIVPYLFLILGFIALKNNNILDISSYLLAITVGIVVGSITSRELFKQ